MLRFFLALCLSLSVPGLALAATTNFTANGNITVSSVTFGSGTANMLILNGSTAQSWSFSSGTFTVTNPGTFNVGSSDNSVKSIQFSSGGTTLVCSENTTPGNSFATAPAAAGTYTVTPSATAQCTSLCSAVSNAASYNSFPTCGAASCNAGYTLSGSGSSATCVQEAGGIWTPAPPIAPAGGFAATASASATTGMQALAFKFGSDVTKIAIADNSGFALASYINATSSVKWPNSSTGTLFVKFCNTYNVCTNPLEISTPTTQSNTSAYSYVRDLTIGITGEDVTTLQRFLLASGYTILAGVTGYFGSQTQAALAAYQKANDINPPAGYFGPLTRASIAGTPRPTITASHATTSIAAYQFARNLQLNDTGVDVRQLQEYLNKHGFTLAESGVGSPGNETNYFGVLTERAVQKFQMKYSIVSSGTPGTTGFGLVGPLTRNKLNVPPQGE